MVFLPIPPIISLHCNEFFYRRLLQACACQQPQGHEPDEMMDTFGQNPYLTLWEICQKPVIFEKPIFRDFTENFPDFVGVDSSVTNKLDDLGKVTLEPTLELLFLLL